MSVGVLDGGEFARPAILVPGGVPLAVGGADHVSGAVIGVVFGGAVGLDDAGDPAPVVIGVLVACAAVGLGVVLVKAHHLGKLPVAVVKAAGYSAVLFNAANLPVE